jgi:hypothetical protein
VSIAPVGAEVPTRRPAKGNAVGVLTAVAFGAFLASYSLFGEKAASATFWGVIVVVPLIGWIVRSVIETRERAIREMRLEIVLIARQAALLELRRQDAETRFPTTFRYTKHDPRFPEWGEGQ